MMSSGGAQPETMPSFDQMRKLIMHHCKFGNYSPVFSFLSQNPTAVDQLVDDEGHSPLHWATLARDHMACQLLVKNFKMNPNLKATKTLQTPVLWAVIAGDLHLLQFFYENGGDIHTVDSIGATCLILSIQRVHLNIFLWLCAMGSDQSVRDINGNSIAHWAAYTNFVDVIRLLIYFGNELDSSQVDNNGCTPIHLAAMQRHFDVCTVLCRESKVDVNSKDKNGKSAIDYAKDAGDMKLALQLEREASFQETRRNRLANAARNVSDVVNEGNIMGALEMILSRAKKVLRAVGITRWNTLSSANSSEYARVPTSTAMASVIGNSSVGIEDGSSSGNDQKKIKFKLKHLRDVGKHSALNNVEEESMKELEESLSGVSSSAWRENFEPETMEEFEKREEARSLPLVAKFFSLIFDLEGRNFGWASGGMRRFFPAIFVAFGHSIAVATFIFDFVPRLAPVESQLKTTTVNNTTLAEITVPWYVSNYFYYLLSVFIVAHVVFYLSLSFSNPGIVPKRARGNSAIEDALELLADPQTALDCDPKRICLTCRDWKPLRSKHCRVCGICVRTMDHHCVWINNCVGKFNHRMFIVFVFNQWLLPLIAFPGMIYMLSDNWSHAGQISVSTLGTIGVFLMTSIHLMILTLFSLALILWLSLLGFEQCSMIASNQLMNEVINRGKYEHFFNLVRIRRKTKVDSEGQVLNNSTKSFLKKDSSCCGDDEQGKDSCCSPLDNMPIFTELPAALTDEEKEFGFAIREIIETYRIPCNPFDLGSKYTNLNNFCFNFGHNEDFVTKPVTDFRNASFVPVESVYGQFNNSIIKGSCCGPVLKPAPVHSIVVQKEEEKLKEDFDSSLVSLGVPNLLKNGTANHHVNGDGGCCSKDQGHDSHGQNNHKHQQLHGGNKVSPAVEDACCGGSKSDDKVKPGNSSNCNHKDGGDDDISTAGNSSSTPPNYSLRHDHPSDEINTETDNKDRSTKNVIESKSRTKVSAKLSSALDYPPPPLPPAIESPSEDILNLLDDTEGVEEMNLIPPPKSSFTVSITGVGKTDVKATSNDDLDDFDNFLMGTVEEETGDGGTKLVKGEIVDIDDLLS